jgi:hypothetical protein
VEYEGRKERKKEDLLRDKEEMMTKVRTVRDGWKGKWSFVSRRKQIKEGMEMMGLQKEKRKRRENEGEGKGSVGVKQGDREQQESSQQKKMPVNAIKRNTKAIMTKKSHFV